MNIKTNQEKFRLWGLWILFSLIIIPVTYIFSLIVVLLVHGVVFGFSMTEGGTYLSQTLMQIAGGAVIGFGTGLYQKLLLNKLFKVSWSWVYTLMIGFAFTELVTCIILWQMGINRYELRFIEFNPLPEALIFACAGLVTGILQWSILRNYFSGSIFWVLTSTLGWGICILTTYFLGLLNREGALYGFIVGALLYGIITGTVLIWILKKKEKDLI